MNLNATKSGAGHRFATAAFSLFLMAAATVGLHGQTLAFSYAQTVLPTTGISGASSVAFDAVGDVYVIELGGQVLKVPVNGGTAVPVLASAYPYAVDSAGNVFVINGSQVLKQPFGGGAAIKVGNFAAPGGVAVDGQNNVYVTDYCSSNLCNTLSKVASDGSGAQTLLLSAGFFGPYVAADKAGDVFLESEQTLIELPAGGGPPVTVSLGISALLSRFAVDGAGDIYFIDLNIGNHNNPLPSMFEQRAGGGAVATYGAFYGSTLGATQNNESAPGGLVVDSQGNVYIADSEVGVREIQRTGSVNFQNVNVCPGGPAPCTETATLFFAETGNVTFGTPKVVSGGQPSPDFTASIVAGGNISCGEAVTGGASGPCALVTFTPQAAGLRTGTVQIVNGSGNILTTVNVSGTGINVGGGMPFITAQTPGPLRNNYTGQVGFEFTVGSAPLQVSELGSLSNTLATSYVNLKLVQANGVDLPGGYTQIAPSPTNSPSYSYGYVTTGGQAVPVTLLPHTSYYLVAQEFGGGASWYDYGPVVSTTDATVIGPTYTDSTGNYITVSGLARDAYVPLNFLYTVLASTTPLGVAITSPGAGSSLSGTVSVTASTSGAVAALQLQVDGVNYGSSVPAGSAISLDTTQLTNGTHTLIVVGSDTQSHTVASAPVSVNVVNQSTLSLPFVVAETISTLRNNYTGFVGLSMTVGNSPVVVLSLGRYLAPYPYAGSGTHLLKLVNSNGTDVPGGSVSLQLAGAQGFLYAALPNPITLQPNTSYFLVSQETAGGDFWYDLAPITTTSVATVTAPVYTDSSGRFVPVAGFSGYSYVPVGFLYANPTGTALSVSITEPIPGAVVSGASVVQATTTQVASSLQLLVDGVNQGSPVSWSSDTVGTYLPFNTEILSNGSHTLTVSATASGSANAVSAPVTVIVYNGTGTATSFITGETSSTTRNNYGGFVGTQITVGSTALSVTSLGRLYVAGNSGAHTVKLVQANGTDVPGGSVSVAMAGGTPGQFVYGTLASPVSLTANTTYYVVSQETAGGDLWYDLEPVIATSAAKILGPTYTDGHGGYVTVSGLPGYSYVPVSFQYQ